MDYYLNDLYDVIMTIKRDEHALDYSTFTFECEWKIGRISHVMGRLKIVNGKLIQT